MDDGTPRGEPDIEDLPAAVGEAAPADDGADAVLARLAALDDRVGTVVERLGAEAERAAARERVIERQREEIERLRGVERIGLLRPVVTDLCALRNGLLRQAGTLPPTLTPDGAAALLRSFADDVEEALERCGVAVLPPDPGGPFVPGRHQAAGTVEVTEPGLDGIVAAVVQDGYHELDGGRVVAPARVTLNRTVAEATPTPSEGEMR